MSGRLGFAGALLLALPFAPAPVAAADDLVIGTGSRAGVYFQFGRSICRILGRIDPVEGVGCETLATAGSTANLTDLRAGDLSLAVVQSDRQYDAVTGQGGFAAAGPDEELRSLFSIHTEPFTIVARSDSGISSILDLPGHRVNVGNPGSGQRGTMEMVMQAMDWTMGDFALAEELPASQHSLALCHDRVQAIVYTVGHPNPSINHATGMCGARIVPATADQIDAMIADRPWFVRTEIPGGVYLVNPEPVSTFGVIATMVAPADLDEQTAYDVVSRVFGNLDRLRAMHPAFAGLDPEKMVRDGLSAPLHPGAERYYREIGLLGENDPVPGVATEISKNGVVPAQ